MRAYGEAVMNKENILRVADAIERGELVKRGIGFNMAQFAQPANPDRMEARDLIDGCGTVACIAGWAYAIRFPSAKPYRLIEIMERERKGGDGFHHRIPDVAAEFLGLSERDGRELFRSRGDLWTLSNITPAHAVAVLRHLAETGKVDWSVGAP